MRDWDIDYCCNWNCVFVTLKWNVRLCCVYWTHLCMISSFCSACCKHQDHSVCMILRLNLLTLEPHLQSNATKREINKTKKPKTSTFHQVWAKSVETQPPWINNGPSVAAREATRGKRETRWNKIKQWLSLFAAHSWWFFVRVDLQHGGPEMRAVLYIFAALLNFALAAINEPWRNPKALSTQP